MYSPTHIYSLKESVTFQCKINAEWALIENTPPSGVTSFISWIKQRGSLYTTSTPTPIKLIRNFFPSFCFQKHVSFSHGLEGTGPAWTGKVTLASGEARSLTCSLWMPAKMPLESPGDRLSRTEERRGGMFNMFRNIPSGQKLSVWKSWQWRINWSNQVNDGLHFTKDFNTRQALFPALFRDCLILLW